MAVIHKCLWENEDSRPQINIAKKSCFRRANELLWFLFFWTDRFEFQLLLTRELDLLQIRQHLDGCVFVPEATHERLRLRTRQVIGQTIARVWKQPAPPDPVKTQSYLDPSLNRENSSSNFFQIFFKTIYWNFYPCGESDQSIVLASFR